MVINWFRYITYGLVGHTLLLLTSCTVGPDYSAPDLSLPAQFIEVPDNQSVEELSDISAKWWDLLGDDTLTELIETSIEANYDIDIAQARLMESRAGRSLANADSFPSVTAQGTHTTHYQSQNSPTYGGGERKSDLFRLGFDASWEIDIFGGVRRSVEAAVAREHAAEASLNDVIRTIMAEVALNYIELRGLQQRKVVLLNNIEVQQRTLTFTRNKYQSGLGTELDVSQSKAQLLSSKSTIPGIEAAIRLRILHLCTLLGELPEQRYDQLLISQPLAQIPDNIFTSTPSDVLRQRPDIQVAERQLAAEIADIGVATAELFPHFSLFGGLGIESGNSGDLLNSSSTFWSIGPSVRWSLFQGGKVKAGIKAQEAQAEAAIARYEKTVLGAIQEVNSALVEHNYERQTARSLELAQKESKKSVELSTTLYQEGLSDILTVLNSELLLLRIEDEYTVSLTREWASLIRLYKAMGGGWSTFQQRLNDDVSG